MNVFTLGMNLSEREFQQRELRWTKKEKRQSENQNSMLSKLLIQCGVVRNGFSNFYIEFIIFLVWIGNTFVVKAKHGPH